MRIFIPKAGLVLGFIGCLYSFNAQGMENGDKTLQVSKKQEEILKLVQEIKKEVSSWKPIEQSALDNVVKTLDNVVKMVNENTELHSPRIPQKLSKTPRSPSEYLNETQGKEHIIVVGGGRQYEHQYGYQYPYNAFLANIDSQNTRPDKPDIDITKPNSIPKDLEGKFDVIILERLPSNLLFHEQTFENIKTLLKKGGKLVLNNPLVPLPKELVMRSPSAKDLQELQVGSGLWHFPPNKSTPADSQFIYYRSDVEPYKTMLKEGTKSEEINNLIISQGFEIFFKPYLISMGFKNVKRIDHTPYWYSGLQPDGYIYAEF